MPFAVPLAADWRRSFAFLVATAVCACLFLLSSPPLFFDNLPHAPAATSRLETVAGGVHLDHPAHVADFQAEGLTFVPKQGGPTWRWQLAYVGSEAAALTAVSTHNIVPEKGDDGLVLYQRGPLVEQYVAREAGVEQQFLLPEKLPLAGADLVIRGTVDSNGRLEKTLTGWAWRNISGVVSLGDVTVLDATGRELLAEMRVTAEATEIVVNGRLLEKATYPVLIDPEIGTNDFQITRLGKDFDFEAEFPAIVYNSIENEFFAVWEGDTETETLESGETEIFGQRLDAITGMPLGNMIRISNVGPDGVGSHDGRQAAVAFNNTRNEYFVVWVGDPADGEFEVYGQRVSAVGQQLGGDIRLSDMGADGDPLFEAEAPAVAYNSEEDEYLVVWAGDDSIDGEEEIYGQRVSALGQEIGSDVRLSDMGPNGDVEFGVKDPDVAYNSTNNEYLVVWRGEDNTPPLVNGENEIFAQRVNAAGAEVGANDFRLSDMGTEGSSSYDAFTPAITYNPVQNEYFIVWGADDKEGTQVNDEKEIFGQRVNAATGAEVGTNDMRLTHVGPDGNVNFEALAPDVSYNADDNQYLVVWYANTIPFELEETEYEVYGQRLNATNGLTVGGAIRLSDAGTDGDVKYDAMAPATAYGDGQYQTVWFGDDTTGDLLDDEFEIFGQLIDAQTGEQTSVNDRRLSFMGPLGFPEMAAERPDVAFNSSNNEYFVVFSGSDNTGELKAGEQEIFGQRINANNGSLIGEPIRLSDMGPNGDKSFDALDPAVVYNPTANQYFVVWVGDNDTGFLVDEEFEVYGQRVNAATGAEIGTDIRLSDMGPDGNPEFEPETPDVVYNPTNNEYFVVWASDDDSGTLVNDEMEIFGQRVAVTGTELGGDMRLSDMGPDGDIEYAAEAPAVAFSTAANEYLVVWAGDDNSGTLVNGESEIFGQRVKGDGSQVGTNDMRLSDAGPDGSGSYDAKTPDVVYNGQKNEFLVVWAGEDQQGNMVGGEIEIFGQRVHGSNGFETGDNDFRISFMAQDGNLLYGAFDPKVGYSSSVNEYLVVWSGDDNVGSLVDDEFEIYGQRVDSDGLFVEGNERLSDMGADGDLAFVGVTPALSFAESTGEFLVVWSGNEGSGTEIHNGFEIFGQRVAATRSVFLPLVRRN